jgi:aromatic ring-cleaving dioxygenase
MFVPMRVRRPVHMGMGLDQKVGRHEHNPSMVNAAFRNNVFGEMLHL